MYCPMCGTFLGDKAENCDRCGWHSDCIDEKSMPNDETNENYRETQPETMTEPKAGENEITADYHTEKKSGISADPVNNAVSYSEKNNKSGLKYSVIAISVLAGLIVIFAAAALLYCNSDSYKTKIATQFIQEEQYDKALERLSDVYTAQSKAIKSFIEVEYAKKDFLQFATKGDDEIEKADNAYFDFRDELSDFSDTKEYYNLPDPLRIEYDTYSAAFGFIDDYFDYNKSESLYSLLYDAQLVFLNNVDRKHSSKDGNNFKLKDLQSRIYTSQAALYDLEKIDFGKIEIGNEKAKTYCNTTVDEFGDYYISVGYWLLALYENFLTSCKSEIEYGQDIIDEGKKEFDDDADLYLVHPDFSYESYVCNGLESISDTDDIDDNASRIVKLLRRDILYYLIKGSSCPIEG